jgi:hypothetical protein
VDLPLTSVTAQVFIPPLVLVAAVGELLSSSKGLSY